MSYYHELKLEKEAEALQAEVVQLKAELKKVEFWQKHYEEVTKLCKVVDAAREFISSTGCNPKECGKCDPKYIGFCKWSGIGQALAELDKVVKKRGM